MDGSTYINDLDVVRSTDIYGETLASKNGMVWKSVPKGNGDTYLTNRSDKIVLYREIFDLTQKKTLGYIAIGVSQEYFQNLCQNITKNEKESVLILDKNGGELVKTGTLPEKLEDYLTGEDFIQQNYKEREKHFTYGDHEVICTQTDKNSSIVCKVVPAYGLQMQVQDIAYMPLILLIGMLIGLMPLLMIISNLVTKPLRRLCEAINEFSTGDFEQQVEVMTHDEVGEVAECFNKTTGERNHGGKLKPEYRKRWAEYICRYIEEYRNRGYHVAKLTMQNEPKAVQTWDSCIYTAEEQKEFLRDYLWPSLKAHGLDDIGIYLWDHNKERVFEWAETIIDTETTSMIRGMAFYWYSGDHFEALRMIREKYPDKQLLLSEACIEYSKFSADDYLNNAQKYAYDMMGNLNEGMNTFLDWNLILNEEGGPNHVGNFCDAPYLFDRDSKELKESNILGYLWHFTHFLEPGAVRIGVSRYTDKLEVTAFEKDDKITFVILNRTDEELTAHIRLGEYCTEITVQPKSIGSGVMTEWK